MRRPGLVHKKGGFRLSGRVESWTSPTLVSVRFASNGDSQYSHQGLRVLIFTDRPGPRARLVGVYIEVRDYIEFSRAVQQEIRAEAPNCLHGDDWFCANGLEPVLTRQGGRANERHDDWFPANGKVSNFQ
ncbi:hypothetical protein AVEN_213441-1 [Araneus ventricosus]|uniref:Uncharacterized protein n=1 Tax=Araneus ventricosus TaxID=182803 RepID=A0A4Y2JV72_ARAVE|nr:hypothetical protein AVEN_213441-1 [Araneus ventricosus]